MRPPIVAPPDKARRTGPLERAGEVELDSNGTSQNTRLPHRPQPHADAPIDLRDARFRRAVERMHRLGPRALAEMLAELAAKRLLRTEIEVLVTRFPSLIRLCLTRPAG